jgi:hypothetical protein
MTTSAGWVGVSLLFTGGLWLGACGGSQQAASKPQVHEILVRPVPEVADAQHLTKFQKRALLGHYSTEDGKSGFIFDRTTDPPKARLDGDQAAQVLSKQPSVRCCVELVSPDRRIWLRVDKESGDVVYFQGPMQHEGVSVVRDADADQLR